jgi:hypothetical protein
MFEAEYRDYGDLNFAFGGYWPVWVVPLSQDGFSSSWTGHHRPPTTRRSRLLGWAEPTWRTTPTGGDTEKSPMEVDYMAVLQGILRQRMLAGTIRDNTSNHADARVLRNRPMCKPSFGH